MHNEEAVRLIEKDKIETIDITGKWKQRYFTHAKAKRETV